MVWKTAAVKPTLYILLMRFNEPSSGKILIVACVFAQASHILPPSEVIIGLDIARRIVCNGQISRYITYGFRQPQQRNVTRPGQASGAGRFIKVAQRLRTPIGEGGLLLFPVVKNNLSHWALSLLLPSILLSVYHSML